jgi:hypothetical protein
MRWLEDYSPTEASQLDAEFCQCYLCWRLGNWPDCSCPEPKKGGLAVNLTLNNVALGKKVDRLIGKRSRTLMDIQHMTDPNGKAYDSIHLNNIYGLKFWAVTNIIDPGFLTFIDI